MSRLYDDKEDISSEKDFFNKRASKDVESEFAIVLFQDKENSQQRHEDEKESIL